MSDREPGERPPVSVIVPFAGDRAEARACLEALSRLALHSGDEVIVVDNAAAAGVPTVGAAAAESRIGSAPERTEIRVVAAPLLRSSYYARNVGAAAARNAWLAFLDADCRPPPSLLDKYFDPPPAEGIGIVAGEVDPDPAQEALAARWARARGHLAVGRQLGTGPHPSGVTANLLIRKVVWEELGGFCEVRSGADIELCWRAAERGWALAFRPSARVFHLHADSVATMLRKTRRYGPGQLWAHRRFPSYRSPPDVLHHLWRAAIGVPGWLVTGRFERAAFKALDLAWHIAYAWGYWADDNRAVPAGSVVPRNRSPVVRVAAELGHAGDGAAVALRRPAAGAHRPGEAADVCFLEDGSPLGRVRALAWVAARHPLRTLAASVRIDSPGPPLRALAPAARRLREAEEIRVLGEDPEAAAAARRLAALLSARVVAQS